jgi:hypothetical protein
MKGTYLDPDAWRNEVPQQGGAIKLLTAIESGAITNATKEELQQALYHLLPLLAMAEHRVVLLANALENTRAIGDANKVFTKLISDELEEIKQVRTEGSKKRSEINTDHILGHRRAKIKEVQDRFRAVGKIKDAKNPEKILLLLQKDRFVGLDGKTYWSIGTLRQDLLAIREREKFEHTKVWFAQEQAKRVVLNEQIREGAATSGITDIEELRHYLCANGVGYTREGLLHPISRSIIEKALAES